MAWPVSFGQMQGFCQDTECKINILVTLPVVWPEGGWTSGFIVCLLDELFESDFEARHLAHITRYLVIERAEILRPDARTY